LVDNGLVASKQELVKMNVTGQERRGIFVELLTYAPNQPNVDINV
jgi:hypothetical protein